LYTVKVTRGPTAGGRYEKAYIGGDFTIDVSKTKILADGFGYAANQYGAVRIWSLSDGFDTGLERHLYIIGEDAEIRLKAYEDADLSRESEAVKIYADRSEAVAREYFLAFSAPFAINKTYADDYSAGLNAITGAPDYENGMYRAYAKALDGLLDVHYFIPRSLLYAGAETGSANAMIFAVEFPAGATRTIRVDPPW
jgi:hypothetical protein